jgi:phosphatidylinositol phospholipase C beta
MNSIGIKNMRSKAHVQRHNIISDIGIFVFCHSREMKEMNSRQAKISVETMREVANDKTLRTKGDKDRRLKEKKQNNTKKFTDERRFAQKKNDREAEKLKSRHDKEMENLVKDVQNVSTWHVV